METEFGGQPVDGGTFPALIFSDIVNGWEELQAARKAESDAGEEELVPETTYTPTTTVPTTTVPPATTPPAEPVEPAEPAPQEPPVTDDPTGGGVGRRGH